MASTHQFGYKNYLSFYLYVSAIDIGGGMGEYIEVLLNDCSLGGDAVGPG